MVRNIALALALLVLSSATARAVEFEAGIGPTVHERCHMDACGFANLQSSVPVATLSDGVLFAISVQVWGAEYTPDSGEHEYDMPPKKILPKTPMIWMAFCSKSRPMMFYFYGGSWSTVILRPGDDDAIFGVNESSYNDYWASCHHFFPKFPNDAVVHRLAPKLGYHFKGGWPDGNPESSLTPQDLIRESK